MGPSGVSVIGANPIYKGSALATQHLPTAPVPTSTTLGVWFQYVNVGGTQTFSPQQLGRGWTHRKSSIIIIIVLMHLIPKSGCSVGIRPVLIKTMSGLWRLCF